MSIFLITCSLAALSLAFGPVYYITDLRKHCDFLHELRYVVSIRHKDALYPSNFTYCMGTLISPQWVLTAATCIDKEEEIEENSTEVRYGAPHPFEQNYVYKARVVEGIQHPLYDEQSVQANAHNLGLLRLAEPIDMNATQMTLSQLQEKKYLLQRCVRLLTASFQMQVIDDQDYVYMDDDYDDDEEVEMLSLKDYVSEKDIAIRMKCNMLSYLSPHDCSGYNSIEIDYANMACLSRSESLWDEGAPVLCPTMRGMVLVGVLVSHDTDRSPLFIRLDHYFSFIAETTQLNLRFEADPFLGGAREVTGAKVWWVVAWWVLT